MELAEQPALTYLECGACTVDSYVAYAEISEQTEWPAFRRFTSKCAHKPNSSLAVRRVRFVLRLSFPVHSALLNSGVRLFTMRLFDWWKREET